MFKKEKQTWFPRVHNQRLALSFGMESAVVNTTTIVPIAFYDEAISPSTISTNPENAAFVEVDSMNCMPDSRIDGINVEATFSMTHGALETDKLHMIKCGFMELHTSFEDIAATDELSGATIGTVLELETESTDRQAMPLYNTVKVLEKVATSGTLDALQPGLTSSQVIEGVAFQPNLYYDALQYHTTKNKLKACTNGLKWFTLTKDKPFRKFKFRIHPKTKRMNEFSFAGLMVLVPDAQTDFQYHLDADMTNIPHVDVMIRIRYNEWNEYFNFKKV